MIKRKNMNTFSVISTGFLWVATLFVFNMLTVGYAFASACSGGSNTLGDVICTTVVSMSDLPGLISGVAYLAGIYFGVSGIWLTKEHVENPNQTPFWDPIKRFLAGGALFAFPTVASAAMNAVNGGSNKGAELEGGFGSTSAGDGEGLDNIMIKFVGDIFNSIFPLLGGFSYLAGLIFIFIGITRLLKTEREGPQGPTGIGTIMTFLIAGALFALDPLMNAFTNSFFGAGSSTISAVPTLRTQAGLDASERVHVENVIKAIIAFMFMVGWISFIRGWFILRDISEGNGGQQSSMMGALTHLIGGALAVNLGPLMNVVQATLGIEAFGVTFGGGP